MPEWIRRAPFWTALAAVGTSCGLWALWGFWGVKKVAAFHSGDATSDLGKLGQVGDIFGGYSALFASLAFVGVCYAAYLQRATLRATLDQVKEANAQSTLAGQQLALAEQLHRDQAIEVAETRSVMQAQAASIARQQFESTFFQLVGLARQLEAAITWNAASGAEAINRMSNDLFRASEKLTSAKTENDPAQPDYMKGFSALLLLYIYRVAGPKASQLDPYFRILYQAVKLVDEAPLTDVEKPRYTNVVRGLLSDGAVFLLALNGLTEKGQGFHIYVERYGLLKHLGQKQDQTYGAGLHRGYGSAAFRSSADRRNFAHLYVPGVPYHEPGMNYHGLAQEFHKRGYWASADWIVGWPGEGFDP